MTGTGQRRLVQHRSTGRCRPTETPPGVPNRVVRANYFQALGIPLRPRPVLSPPATGLDGARAVIVSESVARRFWPGEDPLGTADLHGRARQPRVPRLRGRRHRRRRQAGGLAEERPEAVYVPAALVPAWPSFTFAAAHLARPGEPARRGVRELMRELDPGVPLFAGADHGRRCSPRRSAPARSSMLLVALFAGRGAGAGGDRRLRRALLHRGAAHTELGIRMALGASARSVPAGARPAG